MFCQRDVCEKILDSGGDYFVVVKNNQRRLLRNIEFAFAKSKDFPPPPYRQREIELEQQVAFTFNKGHGRLERREFTSTTILNTHFNWPGVKQVCRLKRTTTRKGITTTEVAYAITSVARHQAVASKLLDWWRGHWRIENQVHWVRDEIFGEDRCRVRTGAAAQVLAAVRNLVMNWLRNQKTDNIARALRENAWNPRPWFAQLGKPTF